VRNEAEIRESLDRLHADKKQFTEDLMDIEMQLGERQKVNPKTGARMTYDEFWSWHQSAKEAKRLKVRQLQATKAGIVQLTSELHELIRTRKNTVGVQASTRVSRLEGKVDMLLAHFGLEYVEPEYVEQLPRKGYEDLTLDEFDAPRDDAIRHRLPGSFESGRNQ
jgi:hypothetical protein